MVPVTEANVAVVHQVIQHRHHILVRRVACHTNIQPQTSTGRPTMGGKSYKRQILHGHQQTFFRTFFGRMFLG